MGINVQIQSDGLIQYLQQIETKALRGTQRLMTWYWGEAFKEVQQNFRSEGSYGDILSGAPSSVFTKWKELGPWQSARRGAKGTGTALLQDSNRLRMSVGTVKKITPKVMEMGTDLEYGQMMHFGSGPKGITPKKGKFLTLPFPGVEGKARDYEDTFVRFIPGEEGKKGIIFQKTEDGGLKPLFLLTKKVVIPARPFLTIGSKTIDRFAQAAANFILDQS